MVQMLGHQEFDTFPIFDDFLSLQRKQNNEVLCVFKSHIKMLQLKTNKKQKNNCCTECNTIKEQIRNLSLLPRRPKPTARFLLDGELKISRYYSLKISPLILGPHLTLISRIIRCHLILTTIPLSTIILYSYYTYYLLKQAMLFHAWILFHVFLPLLGMLFLESCPPQKSYPPKDC